ncbi:hypothetical protein BJV77DRAFT_966872 [Russula vinacea]|nr:hypothetical protein BJV77DRAFT_966872 [Russula vinacea]
MTRDWEMTVLMWTVFGLGWKDHIHGFLWLDGAIEVDKIDWSQLDQRERVHIYFSRFITAWNFDPLRPRPLQDCLVKDLLPAAACEAWDFEDDHCNLCNRCQEHGGIASSSIESDTAAASSVDEEIVRVQLLAPANLENDDEEASQPIPSTPAIHSKGKRKAEN